MNPNKPTAGNVEIHPFFRTLSGLIFFVCLVASVILLLDAAFVQNVPRWKLLIPLLGALAAGISSFRIWRCGRLK